MIQTAIATAPRRTKFSPQDCIHFDEGLIGFPECKDFVLLENDDLAPFRLLQSVEHSEVGFLVLDPTLVRQDYYNEVPAREWESVGVQDGMPRLAFVSVIIGPSPEESTGNLQAPLLINCEKMIGKQVILTDSGYSVRHPLV